MVFKLGMKPVKMEARYATCGGSLKLSEDSNSIKEVHSPGSSISKQSDGPLKASVKSLNRKQKVMQDQGPTDGLLQQYLL